MRSNAQGFKSPITLLNISNGNRLGDSGNDSYCPGFGPKHRD